MEKVYMKVVKFDDVEGTLHVKFASEATAKPIDEYKEHKFLVMDFGEEFNHDLVLSELARIGYHIVVQQEKAEENVRNNAKIEEFRKFVGNEYEFDSTELFACKASENQPPTEGLMEV